MESQGTYQAGHPADADESATPEKVVPLRRGFYMTDNAYVDELMHDLSGAAWKVLTFIIRQTCGYHVERASLSLATFREGIRRADGTIVTKGTGLSSPAIIEALDDLQRAHVITRTDDGKRTTVPSYALRPQDEWTPDALHAPKTRRTCKKILQADDASKKNLQANPETMQKILQVDPSSLSENLTHKIQGEVNTKRRKKTQTDANASGHGVDTPARSKKPRKLSDEQLAIKNAEEEWMAQLFKGIEEINGYPIGNAQAARGMAHRLYKYRHPKHLDGPLPIDRALDCYRLTRLNPFYDVKELTIAEMINGLGAYLSNPNNYRAGMQKKRDNANRVFGTSQNGHAPTSPPSSPGAEDAMTRKGQETRERLRRMREEEAAAKGAHS